MDKFEVVGILDALSQESRLDIFRLLVKKSADGYRVGMIGEKLSLAHATLSFHLEKLYQVGLIQRKKKGRETFYFANYSTLSHAIHYLTESCCVESSSECVLGEDHMEQEG